MSRFNDDIHSWSADEDGPPPVFVNSLLSELHKFDAPRSEQESAISSWLQTHEPVPVLRDDLIRRGYGHLVEHRATA